MLLSLPRPQPHPLKPNPASLPLSPLSLICYIVLSPCLQVEECVVPLPMIIQIGIIAGIGIATLLAVLVYYFW